MKPNIRWQALLAILGFGLVMALLSYQVQSSSLCTITAPADGGTFVEGIVGAPNTLNPLFSDNYPVDRELGNLIYDGLTYYDENGLLSPALAESWEVNESGQTVIFKLRDDIFWHDGQKVTAVDVAFTYGLLQDENYPGPASIKVLWQTVEITQIGNNQIQFTLSEPYSPFLEATTRGILPAHLLEGTTAVALADPQHPFNQTPVGTGPFEVAPNQDRVSNGRLRLIPNSDYWGKSTHIADLVIQFFPDQSTAVDAFRNGAIQAINNVNHQSLPDVAQIPGVRLFTVPSPRYTQLLFSLNDTAHPAMRSLKVRQALAYGLNRATLIDKQINGQGIPFEGPYLPSAWGYNDTLLTDYTFQPITATQLLDEAGWTRAEGSATRTQDDNPLTLRLLTVFEGTESGLVESIAAQWAELGIDTEIILANGRSDLQQKLANREYDVALVEIIPPGDPDLYDFWSQEAIIRGQNYAGWNNRRASESLEAGRKIWPLDERKSQYNAFLRLFNQDLPALTLYQHTTTYALSPDVYEAEIGYIHQPRDRYATLPDWFLLFRDVTISCPANEAIPDNE